MMKNFDEEKYTKKKISQEGEKDFRDFDPHPFSGFWNFYNISSP